MSNDIYYDDSQLMRLFEALSPQARLKAMRGAFLNSAKELRKVAVANFRSSGIKTSRDSERGIRAVRYKRTLGYRVTVGTKG